MSEPDVSDLITVQRAIEILDAAPVQVRTQRTTLRQAMGQYLAQDIVADRDYPPFVKSLMDGFAVRSADLSDRSRELIVTGETRAGQPAASPLAPGQAISIMTGAPLPEGADAVVPIEFVERAGDRIRIAGGTDFHRFVAHRGSGCAAGTVVLQRGTKLEAPQFAVAATVGADAIEIIQPPSAAILATGDELVDVADTPLPHQIRNSNTMMLLAQLARMGVGVNSRPIVRDDLSAMCAAIESNLDHDALFITGGMSVGAYDVPPRALQQLGAEILITKLKIKPGKPFIYARLRGCHIFGLPGNPVAGFVCTARLASRVLRRMMNRPPSEGELNVTLASPLPKNGPREFYQPAQLRESVVHPLEWKGSADVFTLAKADALLIRPQNEPAQPLAASCKILRISP